MINPKDKIYFESLDQAEEIENIVSEEVGELLFAFEDNSDTLSDLIDDINTYTGVEDEYVIQDVRTKVKERIMNEYELVLRRKIKLR